MELRTVPGPSENQLSMHPDDIVNAIALAMDGLSMENVATDTMVLQNAVLRNDIAGVQLLLDKDVDVNSRNQNGVTALQIASGKGNVDMVRLFLKAGANPLAIAVDRKTALHVAASSGYPKMVDMLLKANADVAGVQGADGTTALYLASHDGPVDHKNRFLPILARNTYFEIGKNKR
jgi:uncharacterized protein